MSHLTEYQQLMRDQAERDAAVAAAKARHKAELEAIEAQYPGLDPRIERERDRLLTILLESGAEILHDEHGFAELRQTRKIDIVDRDDFLDWATERHPEFVREDIRLREFQTWYRAQTGRTVPGVEDRLEPTLYVRLLEG